MALHLMRPEWLWALLPAVILILLLWRQRTRQGSWHSVIAPQLLPYLTGESAGVRTFNVLPLVFIAWLLAAFAASGPSWQKIALPIHQKQDALVVLLDLSLSMNAADLAPSRMDRARQKLLDLLQLRREGQTGLIAYAGDAHIVTPLTDDTPTIANLLPALHPLMMPVAGNDPVSAVNLGLELLRSAGIVQGRLLLVTDEVNEKHAKKITSTLQGSGAQLSILGVGTAIGAPIPLPAGGFIKDQSGSIVMPGLNENSLRELADNSGGRYITLKIDNSDLTYLLAENPLATSEKTLALDRTADTWDDQGYWFILPLLVLVPWLFRRGWLVSIMPAALLLTLLGHAPVSHAQGWDDLWLTPDQQGERALQQGDVEAAAKLFENSDWAGTAAYRGEDFEGAVEHFSNTETGDSWYNRGNALAREGKLDEAIAAYQESLKLLPDQDDARANLQLLEELKKQQEQEQQQDGDSQDQDQEKNQEQQDQSKDQQGDSQNQGEEQQQNEQQQNQQKGENGEPSSEQSKPQQEGASDDQPPPEQSDSTQQNTQAPTPEEEQERLEQQQAQAEADKDGEPAEQQPQLAPIDPEAAERDQATEQWLRRVPDDPSGLLREKFRYESRQREQENGRSEDENYW